MLHRDVPAKVGITDLKNRYDVGVVQGGRRTCFFLKSAQSSMVIGDIAMQQLHSDFAIKSRITRQEDLAHPAPTKATLDFERAYAIARTYRSDMPGDKHGWLGRNKKTLCSRLKCEQ